MNSEVTVNELTNNKFNNLLFKTTTDSNPTNSSDTVNNQIDLEVQSDVKWEYSNCIPDFDGNPNDLNRFISVSESLISNFINRTNPKPFKNNSRPIYDFKPNYQPPIQNQQNNFPSQPIPINQRTTHQNFTRASQVFNRPDQNINVFRPNPNANLPKPRPMSISTRATAPNIQNQPIYKGPPPSTNNFRQSKQPNYTSGELYNVDIQENYDPENWEYLNNNYDDSDHTTDQLYLNNSNSNNDDRLNRNENFR
ncbi:GATA zinc finger domain-containing protein 15-like [Diorhabda carinulata]|uniref:GATA zinc finger domain-containing protein 15-like n=1 Tax=Diorhabda carinulata TaxID=1163345 RepID=UPI0025A107DC|nr:GATA zinc finger domain-containing protein 15-like [Diorhabda carinulata]